MKTFVKMKKPMNGKCLWSIFLLTFLLVIGLFLVRVVTGECMTVISDGQIIQASELYEAGNYYDRNGNDVTDHILFQELIGIDIKESQNSSMPIAGVTPWVFGVEDNRFDMDDLLSPNKTRVGGDAKLTYDLNLMEHIADLIAGTGYTDASLVISNWKNGEILATYGDIYSERMHPGSTIKMVITAAALTVDPELENFTYDCTADTHTFYTKDGEYHISCANGANHGLMNLEKAFAKSCNGYFISLLQQLEKNGDKEEFLEVMKNFGFDSVLSFKQFFFWDHSLLDGSEMDSNYLMAAIGQGNVYTTVFGLNLCTNAVVSGTGCIQEPQRVLAKTSTADSSWESIDLEGEISFCEKEVSEKIKKLMLDVPTIGTGKSFYMDGFAAKTGTAQNGKDNTVWTTGGLVHEDTPYSITVCLNHVPRNTSSSQAGKIAKQILTYMIGGMQDDN